MHLLQVYASPFAPCIYNHLHQAGLCFSTSNFPLHKNLIVYTQIQVYTYIIINILLFALLVRCVKSDSKYIYNVTKDSYFK